MGHRANLIIVRNHSYELYYSHWCANTLPKNIFWGEQYAIKFIEMQTKVDESRWLNDAWAEGGAILDADKKKVMFYGGEDIRYNIPLRDLYVKLMGYIWEGWEIKWAYEGIVDLAAYVGYPKEKVLTGRKNDCAHTSLAPPEEKDWVDTVASVKFSPNEMLLFPLWGGIDNYLPYGPDLVNRIDKAYGYPRISLSEWSHDFPIGGFHIDMERRRLEFWHANVIPNISQQLQEKWSDWEVVNHYGDYESQCRCTDGLLQFQDMSHHHLLETLKTQLLKESSNPVDSLALFVQKEAEAGKKVEVNPYALKHDTYELSRNVKEQILDEAMEKLQF